MPSNKLEKFYILGTKAVVFAVPFLPLYVSSSMFFPFVTGKNFIFRILTESAAVLWLGLAVLSKEYRPKNSIILTFVLIFTFIVGLADLLGANSYNSLWSNYERMEGYLTILHLVLYFLVIRSVLKTRIDWMVFLNIFVLVSVLGNFYVLLQRFGFIVSFDSDARPIGIIGNSAFLASYLLLIIFLCLVLIINAKRLWMKIIHLAVIELNLLFIYYTAARGVILSILAGTIFLSLFYMFGKLDNPREKLYKKIALSTIGGILLLSITFFAFRDTAFIKQNSVLSRISAISFSDPTTQFRLFAWKIAWEGIKEKPILGWGQENFIIVYSKYYNPKLFGLEGWADRAHNIVLDWLVNAGFMGLFFYLSIFIAVFFTLHKAVHNKLISKNETAIITTAFIVYFLQNLFVFDTINTYIVFFVLLAYVDGLADRNEGLTGSCGPIQEETPTELSQLKIKSLSITMIALIIFSFSTYSINYKPIKESQLANAIDVSFPKPSSFLSTLNEFNTALSYKTFGDTNVRFKMAQGVDVILKSGLINKKGAFEFIQAAASEMEKLIASNPGNLGYLYTAVDMFSSIAAYKQSFIKKADSYIKECLSLATKNQWIYLAIADNLVLKKDYENAFLSVQKAAALDPQNDEIQLKLAFASILTSREDILNSALKRVKEIRTAKDKDIAAGREPALSVEELLTLAQNSLEVRNFHLALRFYKDIIVIAKEKAKYHLETAKVYLALGEKENAIREAKKAAETDPLNYSKAVEDFIHRLR